MKYLVGKEVFCKRDARKGTVVRVDESTITIQNVGEVKTIAYSTFKRWYKLVPQTKPQEVSTAGLTDAKKPIPAGEKGIGEKLRQDFLRMVKESANQSLDILYDPKYNRDIIKYNGRNVFECSCSKRRYTVLCHPDSLTPDNYRRAEKIFPKDWGWVLRAQFNFIDSNQTMLMKSIITDGLFYRQVEED